MKNNTQDTDIFSSMPYPVPRSMITAEIEGLYGTRVLQEMGQIIKYYDIYENGADFNPEGSNGDYVAADLRVKQTAHLINKEARFLFSKKPDIWVQPEINQGDQASIEKAKNDGTIMQAYVDKVFQKTKFFGKLIKAAKDCFIGKRVACFVNFDEDSQKIQVNFVPSLEFVYEVDGDDIDVLTKIVCFFTMFDDDVKKNQRIYKKKYWMKNGVCWIEEGVYDGTGSLIEELTPERATKFTYIPAVVIRNDGLTGDLNGVSEVENLQDYEMWESKLNSADIDAGRKGMNATRYTVDMSPESTKDLSTAPGAFWDLSSDQNTEVASPQVGILEPSMSYSASLTNTLNRIKSAAYTEVDIPDTSPDAMQGVVTSGKTLKALYWGLIVRCDEKMREWAPALENIVRMLIDGAHLYPKAAQGYTQDKVPDVAFEVLVDNQYSLPEDEAEEKAIDLGEVQAQTMSRKTYMKKWRNLTDDEADAELKQIAIERELLEDSFAAMMQSAEQGSQAQEGSPEGGQVSKPEEPTEEGEA